MAVAGVIRRGGVYSCSCVTVVVWPSVGGVPSGVGGGITTSTLLAVTVVRRLSYTATLERMVQHAGTDDV